MMFFMLRRMNEFAIRSRGIQESLKIHELECVLNFSKNMIFMIRDLKDLYVSMKSRRFP